MSDSVVSVCLRAVCVGVLGVGVGGCTLAADSETPCVSTSQCRAAFGPSNVCNVDTGFCETVTLPPRCSQTFPDNLLVDGAYNDPVVFGTIMDFSLTTQVARAQSVQLAARGANDFDGLEGRTFGVVFCDLQKDDENQTDLYDDNLSQREAARFSARFLSETLDLPAIVGPSASTDTINTFSEIVDGTGTVQISPSSSSAALTGLETGPFTDDRPGMLWRTAPPNTSHSATAASDMRARGLTKIAIVGVEGFGTAFGEALQANFLAEGGESAPLLIFQDDNPTDRDAQILAVATNNPDAEAIAFLASNTADAVSFAQIAATSAAYEEKEVFLSGAAGNSDFLAEAPESLFGLQTDPRNPTGPEVYRLRTVRFGSPEGNNYDNYLSRYASAFGQSADGFTFVSHAYDAGWLVLAGAAWSLYQDGAVTGLGIARGLRQISDGTTVVLGPTTWNQVKSSFRAGQSIDVVGASGDLDYDPETEETRGPVEILVAAPDGGGGWRYEVSVRSD